METIPQLPLHQSAFGENVAVVDGNVYRVLARYFGIDTPIDTTEGKKLFQELAQSLIPSDQPANYNQAIMDFGAIQCTPTSPHCDTCPLCETCIAFREQHIDSLPVKSKKVKQTRTPSHLYLIQYQGLTASPAWCRGYLAGLWELPQAEHLDSIGEDTWKGYAQLVCKDVKHVLTHQILLADLYLWTPQNRPPLPEDFIWSPTEALEDYAYPRLMEILLQAIKKY